MGKFMNEVKSYQRTYRGGKLEEIKSKLSKDDWADFVKAMLDPAVPSVAIIRALEKQGIKISTGGISNIRARLADETR
jgi:hypothetical protein